MKLKAALLVDKLKICKWQLNALEAAYDSIEIVMVLNCQNTHTKKNYTKNLLYYALNLISLNNNLTRKETIYLPHKRIINFQSIYEGSWQLLPQEVYKELESGRVDVVIKFGMSLLRLDALRNLPPILSYHHGNPSKYRGRPAGFYEILNKEKTMGIIVQSISNK